MTSVDISNSLRLLSKNRIPIMGFSILWIMAFHYPKLSLDNPLILLKVLGYGGVDIFFFLSGFGLYYSLSKKGFSLKEYYKRRIIRIMPEYWLVLTILFVGEKSFNKESILNYLYKASTMGYWLHLLNIEIPYFLWYVSAILGFYAIYPLYFKCFKKYGYKATFVTFIIAIISMIWYAIVRIKYNDNAFDPSLIILFFSRIPIFFIGSVFGFWSKDQQGKQLNKGLVILAVLIAILSFPLLIFFMVKYQDYLFTCSLFFIPYIPITPVLSILLAHIFEKAKKLNSLFSYFGEFSYEIYLWHETVFKLVPILEEPIGKINICLLVFFISLAAGRLVYKINKQYIQKIFQKEKKL